MDIRGIDHIAINTLDYGATIHLYRDILGFKELNTVEKGDFCSTYLAVPGGARLEIFDNRGKTIPVAYDELQSGVRHIAFRVKDVKKHEELLRGHGIDMLLSCTELPEFDARVILFYDPNGIVVEFCEKLSEV